jgi:hypothetical protein
MKSKGDPELVVERYMDAIIAEEIKNNPSQITEKARNEIELQLKAISHQKPIDELSEAEKASRQKAPQGKIPVAVKLPPDPAVLEKIQESPVPAAAPPAPAPVAAADPAPAAAQ